MKIKDLILKLSEYNQEANLSTIVHNLKYPFTLSFGGAEGGTKLDTDEVHFYVDELCTNDNQQNDSVLNKTNIPFKCPDCGADLEWIEETSKPKFIKHN